MDRDELLLAFQGSVETPTVSSRYKIGLLLIAITMVLLGDARVERLREDSAKLKDTNQESFDQIRRATSERLTTSLEALRDSRIIAGIRRVPSLHEIELWLKTLSILEGVFPLVGRLHCLMLALDELLGKVEGQKENTDLEYELNKLVEQIQSALTKVRKSIGSAPYPFEHMDGDAKLVDVLFDAVSFSEFEAIYAAALKLLDGYFGLYFRIMGKLAEVGAQVEDKVGISRMEPPPETPVE